MLYVDDQHFDRSYFDRCFSRFDAHPILGRSSDLRIAVRLSEPAFWLALCLYMKERGGTVFPLPSDAPRESARRRAAGARCHYLFFGSSEDALDAPEDLGALSQSPSASAAAALIQMSSGTTGHPKVVERSWTDIDLEVEHYIGDFPFAHSSTVIVAAPVTHSYGLISGVLSALARGAEPRIVSNQNPKYILRKIGEARAPLVYSSPILLKMMCLLAPKEQPIFSMMTSGTTLQKAWFDRIAEKVLHLHQQYGCSEAGCITVASSIEEPGDLGVPLSHLKVRTSEEPSAPSPILVELAGRTVDTGDLGYVKGGRLRFVARVDDMINIAGLNVYPAEVEDVVLKMPGVTEAVVFGKSHALGHQMLALQFVSDRQVQGDEIRAFCAARLTSFQVPMHVTQVPVIPKLPSGKISRKALSEA